MDSSQLLKNYQKIFKSVGGSSLRSYCTHIFRVNVFLSEIKVAIRKCSFTTDLICFSFLIFFHLQDKIRIKSKEEFERLNKGFSHCLRALIEDTVVQQLGHSTPGILEQALAEVSAL
jgi:hypothetical protein